MPRIKSFTVKCDNCGKMVEHTIQHNLSDQYETTVITTDHECED